MCIRDSHPTCVAFALDEQKQSRDDMQSSCAGFYAQACPNSFSRFEAILATSEALPAPPPPPVPPLDASNGGLEFVEPLELLNEEASPPPSQRRQLSLGESYDRIQTNVIVSRSNWLGWDFGVSMDDLYAVEIYLADYLPPPPPAAPSPPPGAPAPTPPPSPPPAFSPRPPPPPPLDSDYSFCAYQNRDLCIFENVIYHEDGVCDDSGPGSVSALCELGSDVSDCGFREVVNCDDTREFEDFGDCVSFCIQRALYTPTECDAACRANPLYQPKPLSLIHI